MRWSRKPEINKFTLELKVKQARNMSGEGEEQPELKYEAHDASKLPRHMRVRYWTSWEELRLMELWRRYNSEVVSTLKNAPVFRKIADYMKEYGFYVNGQECRRKINSLKNKYLAERRRLEAEGNKAVSHWRLYPIIHCVLSPKKRDPNLLHEIDIVNQLINKLPAQPLSSTLQQAPMNPMDAVVPVLNPPQVLKQQTPTVVTLAQNSSSTIAAPPISQKRKYTWRIPPQQIAPAHVLRKHFNASNLEQLRVDNMRLAERRDNALKSLRIEEQEYKLLQSVFMQWQHKQEQVLQRLQCAGQ